MRSRSSAERRATQNSPSSAASIQPTGPAYQPRSSPSSSSIAASARPSGSPPTAGVGCSSPANSTAERGSASWAWIGLARCWMFATLTRTGSALGLDPDRSRRRRALDPARDDLVLGPVLGASAAAARRGGRRLRDRRCGGSSPRAPRSPRRRRAGGREARGWRRRRRPRAIRSRSRSTTGTARAGLRRRRPESNAAGASTATSRASTTFSSVPPRIRSTAAADRSLVTTSAARRSRSATPGGARVEQRHRGIAGQRREPARGGGRASARDRRPAERADA